MLSNLARQQVEMMIGQKKENKKKKPRTKQIANRARHRLLSIYRDAQQLCHILKEDPEFSWIPTVWPVIPNARCGTWYVTPNCIRKPSQEEEEKSSSSSSSSTAIPNQNPTTRGGSCYFKSTDGHQGTWNFSLKRLNLELVTDVLAQKGGCILVDSSVRKVLPDSLSRTVPIWACVLNRIVDRYRTDLSLPAPEHWDIELHTPSSVVSQEEHEEISQRLNDLVETLYHSRAIVHPHRLVKSMTKPIHPIWRSNGIPSGGGDPTMDNLNELLDRCLVVLCVNPSIYYPSIDLGGNTKKKTPSSVRWMPHPMAKHVESHHNPTRSQDYGDTGFFYTPGAADDQESWARHLTPHLFWQQANNILVVDPSRTDDEIDIDIDAIVADARAKRVDTDGTEETDKNADRIGTLPIWIGSRRSGRPPECWDQFDVVLNVTNQEYGSILPTSTLTKPCYYLQLPVAEGKRDRTELERWLPVGLLFLLHHVKQSDGRRILVHCNQGKDRSVAIVLAFVALACPLVFPLGLADSLSEWNTEEFIKSMNVGNGISLDSAIDTYAISSGIPGNVIERLLQDEGREVLLNWIHFHKSDKPDTIQPLANKENLRIALHLIRQDREVADPSRSTMQKLNRFFMSSALYR